MADEIAYSTHDIDDGLASGLLTKEMLMGVEVWKESNAEFVEKYPEIDPEVERYYSVRNLINFLVNDMFHESVKTIGNNKIHCRV